jgi:hypothetical protein
MFPLLNDHVLDVEEENKNHKIKLRNIILKRFFLDAVPIRHTLITNLQTVFPKEIT